MPSSKDNKDTSPAVDATSDDFVYEVTDEAPKKPRNKALQVFKELVIWYPKNYDEPERKLLFKLDVVILTYACLGYFIKSLDSANVKYAYVSGLKEDLGLYGNELNWLNWIYQIGYVLGQIPGLLLISRPKFSRYLFPSLEIVYGILTFSQSKVTHINQLYVIRFFVGFAEAPTYAGTHYVLGKWYGSVPYRGNAAELFKRAGSWFASANLANFFTGHLQAAAYTNLSGVHGFKGWQWLFLIDGIITIPIALLGFVIWPGIPEAGKPWFLTKEQYALVFKRSERYGVEKAKKLTIGVFKQALTSWQWYLFCFNYTIMCICWYPISYFTLWLKAQGTYTVAQINKYPTYSDIIGLFVTVIGTTLASVYPPWIIYSIGASGPLVASIIMSVYHVPKGAVFFAFYYSNFIYTTTTILYSLVNVILREHNEVKAIVLGSMMTFAQLIPTSISFGVFPTTDTKNPARAAPQWNIGWPLAAALAGVMIATIRLIAFLHEREKRLGTAFSKPDHVEDDESSEVVDVSSNPDLETGKDNVKEKVREVKVDV